MKEMGYPDVYIRGGDVGHSKVEWSEDNVGIIKSILPLVHYQGGNYKVRYNFTHLSHLLQIPKGDIYAKLIELYHVEADENKF